MANTLTAGMNTFHIYLIQSYALLVALLDLNSVMEEYCEQESEKD